MHKIHKLQLAFLTYFLLTVILSQVVNTHVNFLQFMLSVYVLETAGFVLATGIIALGIMEFLVAYEHRNQRIAPFFFVLSGFGLLLAGIFPVDLSFVWGGLSIVHMIGAGLHFISFPLALISFEHPRTQLHTYTLYTGGVSFILFLLLLLGVLDIFLGEYMGLVQKLTIIVSVVWFYISGLNPHGDLYR